MKVYIHSGLFYDAFLRARSSPRRGGDDSEDLSKSPKIIPISSLRTVAQPFGHTSAANVSVRRVPLEILFHAATTSENMRSGPYLDFGNHKPWLQSQKGSFNLPGREVNRHSLIFHTSL